MHIDKGYQPGYTCHKVLVFPSLHYSLTATRTDCMHLVAKAGIFLNEYIQDSRIKCYDVM